jgi:uncharacterized membrane protein YfcA
MKKNTVKALRFNALIAVIVWTGWYVFGGELALQSLLKNWVVALTMVFGSLVGGGTSEGGGAVAFPVFTKILHIPPADARVFSLAVQSIGMTAASLTIIYMKIKIEWRAIFWGGIAGMAGITFSTFFIMPYVPPPLVKIAFTLMVSSLAIALVFMNKSENNQRNEQFPIFGRREKSFLMLAGFVGGIMSGLVGCGENIATFMVMVLLFRVCEKVATPTTVLLMTIVTITGFALHLFIVGDFTPIVQGYWLAAVPIVCVGAPLGAVICAEMSRRSIVNFLIFLISLEFISTILVVPMSSAVAATAAATLFFCGLLNWYMCRTDIYHPVNSTP